MCVPLLLLFRSPNKPSGLNRQREINPEGKKVECDVVKLLVFEPKNYEGHGALACVIFAA